MADMSESERKLILKQKQRANRAGLYAEQANFSPERRRRQDAIVSNLNERDSLRLAESANRPLPSVSTPEQAFNNARELERQKLAVIKEKAAGAGILAAQIGTPEAIDNRNIAIGRSMAPQVTASPNRFESSGEREGRELSNQTFNRLVGEQSGGGAAAVEAQRAAMAERERLAGVQSGIESSIAAPLVPGTINPYAAARAAKAGQASVSQADARERAAGRRMEAGQYADRFYGEEAARRQQAEQMAEAQRAAELRLVDQVGRPPVTPGDGADSNRSVGLADVIDGPRTGEGAGGTDMGTHIRNAPPEVQLQMGEAAVGDAVKSVGNILGQINERKLEVGIDQHGFSQSLADLQSSIDTFGYLSPLDGQNSARTVLAELEMSGMDEAGVARKREVLDQIMVAKEQQMNNSLARIEELKALKRQEFGSIYRQRQIDVENAKLINLSGEYERYRKNVFDPAVQNFETLSGQVQRLRQLAGNTVPGRRSFVDAQ